MVFATGSARARLVEALAGYPEVIRMQLAIPGRTFETLRFGEILTTVPSVSHHAIETFAAIDENRTDELSFPGCKGGTCDTRTF